MNMDVATRHRTRQDAPGLTDRRPYPLVLLTPDRRPAAILARRGAIWQGIGGDRTRRHTIRIPSVSGSALSGPDASLHSSKASSPALLLSYSMRVSERDSGLSMPACVGMMSRNPKTAEA